MQYHRIPHSSLEVSTLGLGTMSLVNRTAKPTPTHNSTMPSLRALTLSTLPKCTQYLRAPKRKG
ncbi:putative aldo/keto reductase [Escherichia coli]|nr:putative aldo/keto reductase [Escherichia coli]